MENESKRGGRRAGSGRKAIGGIRHTVRLSPEVDALLKSCLPASGDQRGAMKEFIEAAIKNEVAKHKTGG